jgi:hypothetical protein
VSDGDSASATRSKEVRYRANLQGGIAFSALRQLAIGLAAAGITFGMARLAGVALAG